MYLYAVPCTSSSVASRLRCANLGEPLLWGFSGSTPSSKKHVQSDCSNTLTQGEILNLCSFSTVWMNVFLSIKF